MSDESKNNLACEFPMYDSTTDEIADILADSKTIAVVGLSPKKERPSNQVARYLMGQGYEIYPVNPMHDEILGRKSYASVRELPVAVDVVDIFRRPDAVPEIVSEAIEIGAKTVWMQERVVNNAAAKDALDAGLKVVMNRCMLKEHGKWKK